MNARRPFRIAILNSHPIQYFAPLYAYLNRDPDLDITVLYCSDFSLRGGFDPGFGQRVSWDVDLLAGYRAVFLGERAKRRSLDGFFALICPEVWREIRSGRYDAVVLHGYAYAACVLAFMAARSKGLPVFMRGDSHLGTQRSAWRRRLRHFVLSRAFRRLAGCLAVGSRNRDHYRALGVPAARIFDVPFSVDNERFIAAAALDDPQRRQVRATFGLPFDRPVVLFASKLIPRKHPDDLIEAIAHLRDAGIDAALLLVGTGAMEPGLRARVAALGLDHDVVFGGFVNQAELPRVFAACDIFVLPAENEPWGLVVNEVMCAGLPVVVADEVGCVPDLVRDGVNGRLVRAGDVEALAGVLRELLGDAGLRAAMGRASLDIIRGWSYAECLAGIRRAIADVERPA